MVLKKSFAVIILILNLESSFANLENYTCAEKKAMFGETFDFIVNWLENKNSVKNDPIDTTLLKLTDLTHDEVYQNAVLINDEFKKNLGLDVGCAFPSSFDQNPYGSGGESRWSSYENTCVLLSSTPAYDGGEGSIRSHIKVNLYFNPENKRYDAEYILKVTLRSALPFFKDPYHEVLGLLSGSVEMNITYDSTSSNGLAWDKRFSYFDINPGSLRQHFRKDEQFTVDDFKGFKEDYIKNRVAHECSSSL